MARRRGKRWVAEGYERATRKKRYLGTRDTRREAKQLEAAWKLKARNISRETCEQFASRWTVDYPRPRKSTNAHNAERIQRFARDFKGVRLGDVDRPMARAWALKHPSNLPAVRAMFGDAQRDGLVDSNPFSNLRLPGSPGRKHLVALTETELLELADLALDARMELGEFGREYRAMILFAGFVGLRPGELFALTRADVHGQQVTIERSYSSASRETGLTKTGRSRVVIVPPAAQDALGDVALKASGLLFASPAGRQWTQPSHHRYWARLRLIANRPGLAFYELRHAAATMLLERGVTPWDVSVQLGHGDGGILVCETYGHPTDSGARARLLAAYDGATGPMPIGGELKGALRAADA